MTYCSASQGHLSDARARFYDSFAEGNVNQHVCIIRPDQSRLLPGLLAAYLSIPMMQREIQIEQRGASREGLTLHSIRNFRIIVPSLPEQTLIVAYLKELRLTIDSAIAAARRQCDLMQEYRTSLIAHVVTGKLDVRAAAAQLPQGSPRAGTGGPLNQAPTIARPLTPQNVGPGVNIDARSARYYNSHAFREKHEA